MKRHDYILKIDKPCDQDWSSMTRNDLGRYCSSCSKYVIDFSCLTDYELLQIIQNSTGKLCGRFDKKQIDRLIVQTNTYSSNPQLYKILAGLLLVSTADNLLAQGSISETEIVSQIDNSSSNNVQNDKPTSLPSDSLKIIQGFVTDLNKETLVGAVIKIKGTEIGSTADLDGKYIFKIPDNLPTDTITFEFSYVGYEKFEFSINKNKLPMTKDVQLQFSKEDEIITTVLGKFDVEIKDPKPIRRVKKKWWQRRRKSYP
jgi:hypothetical protein